MHSYGWGLHSLLVRGTKFGFGVNCAVLFRSKKPIRRTTRCIWYVWWLGWSICKWVYVIVYEKDVKIRETCTSSRKSRLDDDDDDDNTWWWATAATVLASIYLLNDRFMVMIMGLWRGSFALRHIVVRRSDMRRYEGWWFEWFTHNHWAQTYQQTQIQLRST